MLDGLTLQMATDALTLCLPGTSVQVFVRCLQIPTLVIVNGIVFDRSGIGPQQEGGGGNQTHKNRGGAIRANAWLGALGLGVAGQVWVLSMGVGLMNTVEKNSRAEENPKKKGFELSQNSVGFGFGFGSRFGFGPDGFPMSKPITGSFIPISRLPPHVFLRERVKERVNIKKWI